MPPEPLDRSLAVLADIVDSCHLILEFTKGYDLDRFVEDPKTQSSVIHRLLVIGEAAKRLDDGIRSAYPDVPWCEIAGMRDRLIHGYHEIDLQEVWDTTQRDVPALLEQLKGR